MNQIEGTSSALQTDMFDPAMQPGRTAGHNMAKKAADHAGGEWVDQALDQFLRYARSHSEFTTEQARLSGSIKKPPTDKAWGQIALRARRQGAIVAAGAVKVAGGRMVATLWRSTVFGGGVKNA